MEAFSLVLFGATGDLAKQKIFPALFKLAEAKLLPDKFVLVASGRSKFDRRSFRDYVRASIKQNLGSKLKPGLLENFLEKIEYIRGDLKDESFYQQLKDQLDRWQEEGLSCGNRVFQLAISHELYCDVVALMGKTGLNRSDCGWVRILIEKPFGRDLQSAKTLDKALLNVFREKNIFRIDHFLAKETVMNLLLFRFANEIFEPIWNHEFVDHVQISALEDFGVEGRERFYDRTGALRDFVQNHVLQMIAMTMMGRPKNLSEDEVVTKRLELLRALRIMSVDEVKKNVVRGQYEGYRQLTGIETDSRTETFVAMRTQVQNSRWQGVPIYIRTGKALARKVTEIAVVFKDLYQKGTPNVLNLRISPNEGIVLRFFVKKPGPGIQMEQQTMQFCYANVEGELMDPYARVLLDVFAGNQMQFVRAAGVEAQWKFVEPIIHAWEKDKAKPVAYSKGSWGPSEAKALIEADGRKWLEPSLDVCPLPAESR